jgi:hypothetical protein
LSGFGAFRAGAATITSGSSAVVTFSSAFPAGTNVIITLGVRDQGASYSRNDCLPTVANPSASGFALVWRDLDGTNCSVNRPVTVNYIAVAAQ